MGIDQKMLELARKVKDEPRLDIYGPTGRTTVVRVDNDCLSEQAKRLIGLCQSSQEIMRGDRKDDAFSVALEKLQESASAFRVALQVWVDKVLRPALSAVAETWEKVSASFMGYYRSQVELAELRTKAREYGISGRVVRLTRHPKARVRKKNLSRLRRMVAKYEKSHHLTP